MMNRAWALAKVAVVAQALAMLGGAVLAAPPAKPGSVYVVSLGPDGPEFGAVNLATGAFSEIAAEPVVMSNLVWWKGSLLSLATSDPLAGYLVKINPENGEMTVIGPTGLGFDAFDLAEVRGKLYLTDFNIGGGSQNLYSVDPESGAATLIGPTEIPADVNAPFTTNADGTFNLCDESFYGLGGTLYATYDSFNVDETTLAINENPADATNGPALYKVDPMSGKTTRIAVTNFFLGASVEVDGKFYAIKRSIAGFADGFPVGFSQLLTLDVATGKATFVRNIDASAGTIFGAAPAPAGVAISAVDLSHKEQERPGTRKRR
jgi:hypothetical protein